MRTILEAIDEKVKSATNIISGFLLIVIFTMFFFSWLHLVAELINGNDINYLENIVILIKIVAPPVGMLTLTGIVRLSWFLFKLWAKSHNSEDSFRYRNIP